VYRAGLSRTLTLVVAQPFTAAATGGFTRFTRAPNVKAETNPTAQAFCLMGRIDAAQHSRPLQISLFLARRLTENGKAVGQDRARAIDPVRTDAFAVADMIARQVE
jgi:hypothetical protein